MTQDQARTRRRGEAFWRRAMTAHRRSGLTQVDFCRRNDLALSTFQYWRRRLRDAEPEASSRPLETENFIELDIRPTVTGASSEAASAAGGSFELIFPSGLQLKVPSSAPGRALAEVLWALEVTGSC